MNSLSSLLTIQALFGPTISLIYFHLLLQPLNIPDHYHMLNQSINLLHVYHILLGMTTLPICLCHLKNLHLIVTWCAVLVLWCIIVLAQNNFESCLSRAQEWAQHQFHRHPKVRVCVSSLV